ncbi:MAG: PASTA domain-containing protein [Ferruginibacter sp.]|nr:PASTA domain-containing protein [Ferruginibacter sp.]
MFKFITNRPFWVNFLAAVILAFLLVFLMLQLLGWITRHGEYLTVPAVKGNDAQQSIQLLESKGFEVVIQDSVYTDSLPQGTVIKQLPDANATVKINRTVFLTINRYIPPMIVMPQLEGKSLSFALDLLERNHLKLGDTIYKPDFMKGSVLEQQYHGVKILQGAKVRWGSKITLIIAGGLNEQQMMVPDLIGLTFGQAKSQLELIGINIAGIIADGEIRDTAAAFIYKQNPEPLDEEKRPIFIRPGQLMDLYISPVMILPKDSADINKQ